MGSARDEYFNQSKKYLAQFKVCKGKSYASEEYQALFRMADELIQFIVDNFKAQKLDGKDLFDSEVDIDLLFPMTKDEALKNEIKTLEPQIKEAIRLHIQDG